MKREVRFRLLVVAVLLGALAVGVGVARAGGGATLSLQVYPGTLAPGGSGAVAVTFGNDGPSTLTHVIVEVALPAGAAFDAADSSSACSGTGSDVTCSLGKVSKGATVVSTIAFDGAPGSGTASFSGQATWDAPSAGTPNGTALSSDTTSASASAEVLSGVVASSSCRPAGDSLHASTGAGQGIDVTAGANTLGLTCTPILVGIDDASIAFTKLPTLTAPAHVTLTFPDETLPWPADQSPPAHRDPHAPTMLIEYPSYPSLSPSNEVHGCVAGAIPAGADACIVTIDGSGDPDGDFDAGTITLLVQGSATGDPGFHGV